MLINVKEELNKISKNNSMSFNDVTLNPEDIKAVMINEIVPNNKEDDFYELDNPMYLSTTIPLFQEAGAKVNNIQDILDMGVYITNAVKIPKDQYEIPRAMIEESLPYLEKELSLFSNVKVVMLMGDVAKKAYNMITKKATKKNVIPAISTYKLRNEEFYYDNKRIIPSYIMTGKNILIEKSKFRMASEDIETMIDIIKS